MNPGDSVITQPLGHTGTVERVSEHSVWVRFASGVLRFNVQSKKHGAYHRLGSTLRKVTA